MIGNTYVGTATGPTKPWLTAAEGIPRTLDDHVQVPYFFLFNMAINYSSKAPCPVNMFFHVLFFKPHCPANAAAANVNMRDAERLAGRVGQIVRPASADGQDHHVTIHL
jgi:hypothetical protein